jgi:hypothetical protein
MKFGLSICPNSFTVKFYYLVSILICDPKLQECLYSVTRITELFAGHKVCKLMLLKRWDPTYKKLCYNRETRQLMLWKTEQGAKGLGKPSTRAFSYLFLLSHQ